MGLNVTIEGPDMAAVLAELEKKINNAQEVLTVECKVAADTFTPMDSGSLKNNFEYTTDEHGAKDGWTYKEPYARRQWWGITDGGKPFNYSILVNDKARSRWTEHAAEVFREHIIKVVKAALQ